MKTNILNSLFVGLILLLSTQGANAQQQNLTQVLEAFTERYQIYFSYDAKSVKTLKSNFQFQNGETPETALSRLLSPLGISYNAIGSQFYILEQRGKNEATSSSEKAIIPQNEYQFLLQSIADGSAVADAFVFIRNSSIGTSTDLNGQATLKVKNLEEFEIVITHINFKDVVLKSHQLEEEINVIFLEPKSVDLNEVVIKTKKKNSRKRKQWMRRFKQAFLGNSDGSKQVKILNPEVIWFEEKEGILEANAIDYLQLENKKTAYEIRFFLDQFTIDQNNDTKYAGKVFFKEINSSAKKRRKITRLRDQYYLNSKTLFFKSLVQRLPINEQRFEFGVTAEKEKESFAYEQLTPDQLSWRYGMEADTLYLWDFLTVINKKELIHNFVDRGNSAKGFDKKLATSFLRSKTGKFILDHNGNLLNQDEIEESGYWANYRMAAELPINYQSQVTINNGSAPHKSIDSLNNYRARYAQEKVYLHLNKNYYSNRENLWFKAYLFNAVDHSTNTKSDILYVDLISPEGTIIKNWMLHKEKGFHGDFQLNRNYAPGNYTIRAYTNYMKNAGQEFYFQKSIPILNFLTETEENVPLAVDSVPSGIMVNFFPEGGDLIANLPSNVAFSATDQFGNPIEVQGQIFDQNQQIVTSFKTLHKGHGTFSFIPNLKNQYYAKINYKGETHNFEFPAAVKEGLQLNINASKANDIFITISASREKFLKKAFLVGHIRGAMLCYIDDLSNRPTIRLNKDQLPPGIIHFTLFDEQSRPQAERLIFNEKGMEEELINLQMDQQKFGTNQEIVMPIALDKDWIGEPLDLSVSVTNTKLVSFSPKEENIISYLFLNSDLSTSIEEPNYYLNAMDNSKRYFLDLLLQCKTWRRFTWKDLLNGEIAKEKYSPEKGYSIQGYTTHKGKDERVQTEVMLNSFDENFIYKKVLSDENGAFQFSQLPTMDSTTYIIQGRINEGQLSENDGKVSGNRLVDFHLLPSNDTVFYEMERRKTFLPKSPPLSKEQKINLSEKSLTDDKSSTADWQIELDEVTVSARRNYTSSRPGQAKFYNLDAMDWIEPTDKGRALLSKLAPRYNFQLGAEGKLYANMHDDEGMMILVPVIISIDGMGAEPGGSNAIPFLSLPADDIATIFITKTAIGVTTRSISRTREAYLESGILRHQHPAYSKARTFFTPNYPAEEQKELRTAIYWNPDLRFDANGKACIKFKTGPEKVAYQIRIEGMSNSGQPIFKDFTWK